MIVFTYELRSALKSLLSFAMHPRWAADYFMHEKFELPQLKDYARARTISPECRFFPVNWQQSGSGFCASWSRRQE
jgi:hypothetical protein